VPQPQTKTRHGSASVVVAYSSLNQVLVAGANILNIDALFFNTDRLGEFNTTTHRFTPRTAGWYLIEANIEAQLFAGAPLACGGYITRNGVTVAVNNQTFTIIGWNFTSNPSIIIYLTTAQWIDVRMTGFALPNTVTVLANNTRIRVCKIR